MPRERIGLLAAQMEETYGLLRQRLEGLSESEYCWEPVPGAWTIRRLSTGRWGYDYAIPDPKPAPFTTLAWRLTHLAMCKVMYHEYAYGPAALTWDTIETPPSMNDCIRMLEDGQALLADDLAGLRSDDELEIPRATNWGDVWPAWRVFWTMISHDAHHGGEIGCVRDLYAHSAGIADG